MKINYNIVSLAIIVGLMVYSQTVCAVEPLQFSDDKWGCSFSYPGDFHLERGRLIPSGVMEDDQFVVTDKAVDGEKLIPAHIDNDVITIKECANCPAEITLFKEAPGTFTSRPYVSSQGTLCDQWKENRSVGGLNAFRYCSTDAAMDGASMTVGYVLINHQTQWRINFYLRIPTFKMIDDPNEKERAIQDEAEYEKKVADDFQLVLDTFKVMPNNISQPRPYVPTAH